MLVKRKKKTLLLKSYLLTLTIFEEDLLIEAKFYELQLELAGFF